MNEKQTVAVRDAAAIRGSHYAPYGISEEIKLLEYWRVVWKYKVMILTITILSTLLAVVLALVTTPVYRAELLMGPADAKDNSGGVLGNLASQYSGLASLAGIDLGGSRASVSEAVATLESQAFTRQFIEEQNLLPALFPKRWDSKKRQWRVEAGAKTPTLRDGTRIFQEIENVRLDRTTGLVTLSIDWTDREQASRWANLLVERVNELLRARAISEAQESLKYLNKELAQTSVVELRQAIYRLIEIQINKIMLANVRSEYAFKVIDPAPVLGEEDRIWPRRSLMVMIGFLIGAFVGIFTAFLRNLLMGSAAV